jgi:hypothetical protein
MALVLPKLDDKPFSQIAEEARLLIPSSAPEWTDHNVHDPGITFVELFAWLAEIEHYRLNRTATTSYQRFFSLMGLTPFPARAAEVVVPFEFINLTTSLLLPANTGLAAVGVESIPFQTIRDQFLTKTKLTKIVTHAGDRQIVQTTADGEEPGHYDAFGHAPVAGDFLLLEFDEWFTEPETQLEITLFEGDLPAPRKPLTEAAPGFLPSATVRWEYRRRSIGFPSREWEPLEVIRDGTLSFSRSGDLIFKVPEDASATDSKQIRALLTAGRYEIPPRIVSIRTNTIRARQVENIVNEALGGGLGSADQTVRLKKYPLFVNTDVSDGPFQVGEVVDWRALINRLNSAESFPAAQKKTLSYIYSQLDDDAKRTIDLYKPPNNPNDPTDEEKYTLGRAFNSLIESSDFYQRAQFEGITISEDDLKAFQEQRCQKRSEVRRSNRLILQKVFRDLFLSDRLEIQTSVPGVVADEGLKWRTWDNVESFEKSTPDDNHYVFDSQTGIIHFGNGLNGRVPNVSELIRARFYRYSQLEKGNLPANRLWTINLPSLQGIGINKRKNITAAVGGRAQETIDETKSRSREVFRKETAVLTAKDYETLVKSTPGLRVARVKVLPNFNPNLPCLKLPGVVTILVEPHPAPRKAFPNAVSSEASAGFLSTVRNYLENRRMVTTDVHVIGPAYVAVNVSCRVFLKKRVAEGESLRKIKEALSNFFDPVFGGPEKGQGWPFGRSVFPSEVSQQISRLPGVDYVTTVKVNDLNAGVALKLRYNELPKPGEHAITMVPFEDRERFAEVG